MKILTIKQVSEILQAKASTVYAWAEQGRIPCFKINGLFPASVSFVAPGEIFESPMSKKPFTEGEKKV